MNATPKANGQEQLNKFARIVELHYTLLNDDRFVYCGNGKWGLREWYKDGKPPAPKLRGKYAVKKADALERFRQGASLRQVCKQVGLSKATAAKYRMELKGETILCECGKDSNHNGWCDERVKKSEARQAYLDQFKSKL